MIQNDCRQTLLTDWLHFIVLGDFNLIALSNWTHSVKETCLLLSRQSDLFDYLFDISLSQLCDEFYEQIAGRKFCF